MLILVLPAYNEEYDLGILLERVCQLPTGEFNLRVLVVNDGSTDATERVARAFSERLDIHVINHNGNQGLGRALLTGLQNAAENSSEGDVVVTMDADNTHNPALIADMARRLAGGLDVVIASRYAPGGEEIGLSAFRKICSGGASRLLRFFYPISGVRDYTCGYRAYSAAILQRAFRRYGPGLVAEQGFTCMAEVLIKLRALNAQMGEVPLVLRYDLKTGPSKMKVLQTVWRYFLLIEGNRGLSHR
jgi:dolichol-phosphate mannosyltransferase